MNRSAAYASIEHVRLVCMCALTIVICIRPVEASSSNSLTIYAPPGLHVSIADALGRRVGFVGGTTLKEIPDAAYFDESIKDDEPTLGGDQSVPARHVLTIRYPQGGTYTLTITGLAVGSGKIEIFRYSSSGPQTKQTVNVAISTVGQTISQTLSYSTLPGDLNGDGRVDCSDVSIVRNVFGKRLGQNEFDPVADTNRDGVVDVRDLSFVSQKLVAGTRCQ